MVKWPYHLKSDKQFLSRANLVDLAFERSILDTFKKIA